jgi:alpha-tubulin suppressor-like RCC1 family protein
MVLALVLIADSFAPWSSMRRQRRTSLIWWLPAGGVALSLVAACKEPTRPGRIDHQIADSPISAGGVATCGITTSGVAYCWGGYELDEDAGGEQWKVQTTPREVAVGRAFKQISTGFHTCGLTTTGAIICWGRNWAGQLGDGTTESRNFPVEVRGGFVFKHVTVGVLHTCGITLSGAAYCWGSGWNGEIGDGAEQPRSTPIAVGGGHTFRAISAGLRFTCGVTTSGAAYCWGLNDHGQLGNGSTSDHLSPSAVAGGLTFTQISAGARHACGLAVSGAAYCWGRNELMALGDGTTEPFRDAPVAVSGGYTFVQITAGNEFSCALTPSGAAYCWGAGGWGNALGHGSHEYAPVPTAVAGGLTFNRISVGSHTVATTPSGAAYTWGTNWHGELGDGTTQWRYTPAPAAVELTFK